MDSRINKQRPIQGGLKDKLTLLFTTAALLSAAVVYRVNADDRRERFRARGTTAIEEPAGLATLLPTENTSSGVDVSYGTEFDPVPDPEDDGIDVKAFADFMRATKAPARGPITADEQAGEVIFKNIGCAVCHVDRLTTAQPGTPINGGKLAVSPALGNKIIHPYSDFLLHNVGSGDGIPVSPDLPSTAQQMRTAPLWGLRTRNRLMHDGLTFTAQDAIERHGGQAFGVRANYRQLSDADKAMLISFLDSL
jgi:CxxC motif-containing protein (DUF1111 family)